MNKAVIIASGPSLTQDDVEHVKGKAFVLAINDSYKMAPWAHSIYACDMKWWKHHNGVPEFLGLKMTIDRPASLAYKINHVAGEYIDFVVGGPYISIGNNSGHQALGIVANMGFEEIFLLGFDFKHTDKTHWFGDHPFSLRDKPYFERWIEDMDKASKVLKQAGIRVINCSPDSNINCFEKRPIKEVI